MEQNITEWRGMEDGGKRDIEDDGGTEEGVRARE